MIYVNVHQKDYTVHHDLYNQMDKMIYVSSLFIQIQQCFLNEIMKQTKKCFMDAWIQPQSKLIKSLSQLASTDSNPAL